MYASNDTMTFEYELYFIDEGEVFSWGNNEYGQLAVDKEEEQVCLQLIVNCILL